MRFIKKSEMEPPALAAYRKSAGDQAYWDGFDQKSELRPQLLKDQGYLCCCCMCRIREETMKIEHYQCRKSHPEKQLHWQNLLAACRGGEGGPVQTCDTAKGDRELSIDPRNRDHMQGIRYLPNGRIVSGEDNLSFENDINETLQLNTVRLQKNRQAALDGFKDGILRKRKGHWPVKQLEKELQHLLSKEELMEFAGIIEYWLKKRLTRG